MEFNMDLTDEIVITNHKNKFINTSIPLMICSSAYTFANENSNIALVITGEGRHP